MANCRSCQAAITWERKGKGWRPLSVDGTRHACGFRKKAYTGPLIKAGKEIIGASYAPSCGLCELPPWERCACSIFPVHIASEVN